MNARFLLVIAILHTLGCVESVADENTPVSCMEDRFGTSSSASEAPQLDVGQFDDLMACPNAPDRFRVAREDARWSLNFRAEAPITVRLLDGEGELLEEERGTDVSFTDVFWSTLSVTGEGTSYTVSLSIATEPETSCSDGAAASLLFETGVHRGHLCDDGVRHLRPRAMSGDWLSIEVSGEALEWMEAFEEVDGEPVRTHRLAGAAAARLERMLPADNAVWLRLKGAPGSSYRITMTTMSQSLRSVGLSGRVEAKRRRVLVDGLGPESPLVPAGARLAVTAGEGGALLMTARLDERGAFAFDALVPDDRRIGLSVVADVANRSAGGRSLPAVRVSPEPGGDPWAESLYFGMPDALSNVDLRVSSEGPMEPALSIATTAANGLLTLAPHLPASPEAPPVSYRWRPGTAEDCGTCFREGSNAYVALSGRASDPDEWDENVILHELSHYIATLYGQDDSTGGPHDGRRTTPELAWSEGFAIFGAGLMSGTHILLDYKVSGVRIFDLESVDEEAAFGTATGEIDGNVSEHLVAAVLWDLYDDPVEDDDPFTVPIDLILGAFFEPMQRAGRGAEGYDLVDYLDMLACRSPSSISAIEAVVEIREYPYEVPSECP